MFIGGQRAYKYNYNYMILDMVNTNSILNVLGQNFWQIEKTFKAQDSPEVFGQLTAHLGSPHGEVGLAIWQNSKSSNSNVEWVTWECGSGLHNLASSYSNLEKSPNFAKSNFAIWQTWWRRQMNLTKWPSKWHSILTQVNIFPIICFMSFHLLTNPQDSFSCR